MKPCMQHVGHPKCHPAGRKAEETPIDDQNASRKVTGGAKITEHPSKTWGKAWKSTELPSSFVQVSKCHSLADRRQQECQRKSHFGFLIPPKVVHFHLQETPKLIRHISGVCKAKAEIIFVTQTHKFNFLSILIQSNTS